MKLFKDSQEFEWDKGNKDKNYAKHGVSNEECEEVFFDPHKRIIQPGLSLSGEERFILIGKTKKNRLLFLVFTIRKNKLRVISARDLNKKERSLYEEAS